MIPAPPRRSAINAATTSDENVEKVLDVQKDHLGAAIDKAITTVVSRRKPRPLGKFKSSVDFDVPFPRVKVATRPESAIPVLPV